MEQYEHQYRQAFAAAVIKVDPNWKAGNPVPAGALDSVTRESVENSSVNNAGTTKVDIKL